MCNHWLYQRILVGVDGSESARKALELSIYLAQVCNSKLDIIHVVVDTAFGGDSASTSDLIQELRNKGKLLLERCKSEATKNNVQAGTVLEEGDAAQVIIETANNNNSDLIVVGSRGLGFFKELLLGSVSSKVLQHARCSVMVAR